MGTIELTKHKQALLDYLGSNYTKKIIDKEPCIYRDFGSYDIEISGGHKKREKIYIYLWQKEQHLSVIEQIEIPNDFERVKYELDNLISNYNLT